MSATSGSPRGSPRSQYRRGSRSSSPGLVLHEPGRPVCACLTQPPTVQSARNHVRLGWCVLLVGLAMVPLCVVGFFALGNEIASTAREAATLSSNTSAEFSKWADNSDNPITLSVYAYHLLNPAEMLQGEKPALEEVGPFVYRDIRKRFNTTWNANRTQLSYQQWEYYEFVPELSVANHSFRVRTANLPFLGLVGNLYGTLEGAEILSTFYGPLPEAERMFTNRSIYELLFGYVDPVLAEIHADDPAFPERYPGLLKNMTSEADSAPPSVIWSGVDSPPGQFRALVQYEGESVMYVCQTPPSPCAPSDMVPAWGTVANSRVGGSDGSQISPGVDFGSSFMLWSLAAFRQVRMINTDSESADVYGLSAIRFRLDPLEMENSSVVPANAAYYQVLTESGMFNISRIADNEAIFVTRPHLVGVGEPAASSVVVDYTVELDDPYGYIDVEPITGVTVDIDQSSQLNLLVYPLPNMPNTANPFGAPVTWFANMSVTLLPIMWFRDQASVTPDDANRLGDQLYTAEDIDQLALYLGVPMGVVMILLGAMMIYYGRARLLVLEPVEAESPLPDEPESHLLADTGINLYGSTDDDSRRNRSLRSPDKRGPHKPSPVRASGPIHLTATPAVVVAGSTAAAAATTTAAAATATTSTGAHEGGATY